MNPSGDVTPDTPSEGPVGKVGFTQRAKVPFSAASRRIGAGKTKIANLVKLEVVVTALCFLVPFLVLFGDDWNVRGHISAYYAMEEAQYFYFPLTVAAMLFVVNGVVRDKHWYNLGLGFALAGVVFFNHVDHSLIHDISAAAFFLGNALVFVIFTPKKELWFKIVLSSIMIAALAGHFVFGWYSLFLAESLSLWIIATHFILEAKGLIE